MAKTLHGNARKAKASLCGLNAKGGLNAELILVVAVTTKPSKLKKGSKSQRRKSFCGI